MVTSTEARDVSHVRNSAKRLATISIFAALLAAGPATVRALEDRKPEEKKKAETTDERLARIERLLAEQAKALKEKDREIEALKAQGRQQQKTERQLKERVEALEAESSASTSLDAVIDDHRYLDPSADAGLKEMERSLSVNWWEGLYFEKKGLQLKLGGRIINDWFSPNEDGAIADAIGEQEYTSQITQARLNVVGLIYDRIIFQADYDFVGRNPFDNSVDLRSIYIGIEDLPYLGTWRVGRFNHPFSLEDLTSTLNTTFVSRALSQVLVPGEAYVIRGDVPAGQGRSIGTMFNNSILDDRMTWALGYFRQTLTGGPVARDDDRREDEETVDTSDGRANWAVTGRITGLPWYAGKSRLLHLGAAYSYQSLENKVFAFGARPELPGGQPIVGAQGYADSVQRFNAEAAWVFDRFSLQGQYIGMRVDRDKGSFVAVPDPEVSGEEGERVLRGPGSLHNMWFHSFYTQLSVFLTGEHRNYLPRVGWFGRVRPKRNFLDGEGGLGAFELALRVSRLNFGNPTEDTVLYENTATFDPPVTSFQRAFPRGGHLWSLTTGLNWYLNPNTRFMFNYGYARVRHGLSGFSFFDDPDLLPEVFVDDYRADGSMHSIMIRFQLDF